MTDSKKDSSDRTAAAAAPSSSRPAISISLRKKKRTPTTANNKLASLSESSLVEEYSTIAAHAESISQRRREDGELLIIPCKSNEGEEPLLAKRGALLRRDAESAQGRDDPIDPTTEEERGIEDDLEATLQLIQSADHRHSHVHAKRDGLAAIAAPSKNEWQARYAPSAASANDVDDDELFRRDVSLRAEDIDPTSSTYAHVGIQEFGSALLRGMGWTGGSVDRGGEGQEVKARPHRLGLGATPLLPHPVSGKGSGSGVVRRARRPEEVKREEERERVEAEREKERLEKQRLDVQFTLQRNSVVWVYGQENGDEGNGNAEKQLKFRAQVVQTAGVPGLNRILVRMEDGQDRQVSKGCVVLCSWEELKANPFQIKKRNNVDHENKEEERHLRRDTKTKRDPSHHNHQGDNSDKDRYRKNSTNQENRERHRDHTRNAHEKDEYSDDDSHYRHKRKVSSRDKHYNDDYDNIHHRRRQKESSHVKHYSDDDSNHKRKRKESLRRKRDDSEERNRSHSRTKNHDTEGRDSHKRDKDDSKRSRNSSAAAQSDNHHQKHLNWLLPNIRVRLVSKRYPRQHLQKGIVQDVISSSKNHNPKAVILMDNQEVLDNIPERYLETALPKTGGNVVVLEGSHRWKKGRLLERSSERSRGIIQLFEDFEVVELSLDGVAEWCGPVDDDLS
ncbi:hypothetical protein ACHAWX_007099 [Stephanocyclus meneghinianus]